MNFKFETHPHVSVAWCFFGRSCDGLRNAHKTFCLNLKGTTRYLHLKHLYLFCADTIFPPLILTPASYPFFLTFVLFFQCIDFSEKKYSAVEKLKFPTLIFLAWLHQLQLMGGTAPHKLIIFDFEFLSGLASWFFCCLTN